MEDTQTRVEETKIEGRNAVLEAFRSGKTIDKLYAYAKKNKLLMTGGSDFHGMYNREALSLGDFSTPKTQLTELLGYKAKVKRQAKKAAASEFAAVQADAE